MLDCLFPKHFYTFHDFLNTKFPSRINDETVGYIKTISQLYKSLKGENDLLLNS